MSGPGVLFTLILVTSSQRKGRAWKGSQGGKDGKGKSRLDRKTNGRRPDRRGMKERLGNSAIERGQGEVAVEEKEVEGD